MSENHNNEKIIPVIFLAFAGDLRNLPDEYNRIGGALRLAETMGWCEVVKEAFASIETIFNVFQDPRYRDRIAVFHYGGHADSWGLVLQDGAAHKEGLVPFLVRQQGLTVIFLNGCSTAQQARELTKAGIPAVIGTHSDIADKVAADLAVRFYQGITEGLTLEKAWQDAENFVKTNKKNYPDGYRRVHWEGKKEKEGDFPWGLYHDDKRPEILKWKISTGNTLQVLREGSQIYFKALRSDTGRFRHLRIADILLPGTENKWLDSHAQVDQTPGGMLTREVLPFLWKRVVKHAVIVGDGGMGKTVSLIHWWEKLLEPVEYSHEMTVPVFIALNEFNQVSEEKREGFILEMIRKHYGQDKVRSDQIEAMMKTPLQEGDEFIPSLVLLLDGFNEITVEKRQFLIELNRLVEQSIGIQIVMTSRYDMRGNFNWGHWSLVRLKELDEDKVAEYFQGKGLAIPNQERLRRLIQNPMMLTLYAATCEIRENHKDSPYCCFKDTVESAGELLWNFMEAQVAKLPERLGRDEGQVAYYRFLLKFFLPGLGYEMEKQGLFNFTNAQFLESLDRLCLRFEQDDFFDTYPQFDDYLDILPVGVAADKKAMRMRTARLRKIFCQELNMLVEEGQALGFLHQDFRDFFAAVHVLNEMEISLKKNDMPGVLKERPLDFFVRRFMGEIEGEHRCKPYLARGAGWKIDINKETRLHKIMDLCRGKFGNEVGDYTVWNIVTIWKEVRGELSGADLSGLDLSGISLNRVRCSRFYKDEKGDVVYLAAGFDGARVHEKDLLPQEYSLYVISAVYSPDGKKILSASWDNTIKEWDADKGQCLKTLVGHEDWVESAVYSPDGKKILSSSNDKTIKEWDAGTEECVKTLEGHSSGVVIALYSPNGEKILSASEDNTIKEWDADTGQCLKTLAGHDDWVNSAVYSPDGKKILSASHDQTIKEWDASTGECLKTLADHDDWVNSAVYSADGKKILSASEDKTIKEWEAATGKCVKTLEGHSSGVVIAVYSADGKKILSASYDNTIRQWDAGTGRCVKTLAGHSSYVYSAVYSPDGKKILSASDDQTIRQWDAGTGQCVGILAGQSHWVNSAMYSPDGKKILSASDDNTIKEWDVATGQCVKTLAGHTSTVWSALYSGDGKKILSASNDQTIKEWDAGTGECVKTLTGHSWGVRSAVYSADGKKILSASGDCTIKEWDAGTGECVGTLVGHTKKVEIAVYSADGGKIFSASRDNTIKEWDAAIGQCLKTHQKKDNPKILGFPNIGLRYSDNTIYVPTDSGKGERKLINVPGLFIQECSFQNLEKGSQWTEKGLKILKMYNALL